MKRKNKFDIDRKIYKYTTTLIMIPHERPFFRILHSEVVFFFLKRRLKNCDILENFANVVYIGKNLEIGKIIRDEEKRIWWYF